LHFDLLDEEVRDVGTRDELADVIKAAERSSPGFVA
jgi:hypothetical protein